MNAIRNLLSDHEEVHKLFNQYVDAGEEAYQKKQTIMEKVIEEIMENARKEEEILFPAFKEKGGEEAEDLAPGRDRGTPCGRIYYEPAQKDQACG